MRRPRGRYAAGVVVLLTVALSGVAAQAAPVTATDPTSWQCDSAHLGLDKDTVQPAPTDVGDRTPTGGPITRVPDSRGRYIPIVMVHGWVGKSTHTTVRDGAFSKLIDLTPLPGQTVSSARSLIGQLQSLPGAAVFTFDYRDYSARWVDDNHLGPALGKVVDCLYRASGEKVIIVGHSMGGLIARYAATHPGTGNGSDRSAEISTVITFGTPETGSIAAMLAAGALDAAAALYKPAAVIRTMLAECGRQSSKDLTTGSLCDGLKEPIRAFESDAGVALRYGSPQLAALKPFPPGITVDALAGQTTFQLADAGWFGLGWDPAPVDVGDMIVSTGSALRGATATRQATCAYRLDPVHNVTDSVALHISPLAAGAAADQRLSAFSTACIHTTLMRDITLTNEATGEVSDDIAARQPVTATDLLRAPVPAACQHKAGTLVNGSQPGIPPGHGSMGLGNQMAFGDLTGDGYGDAAAVLVCGAGGVPWPDLVAFYSHGPKLLGAVSLNEITIPGVQPGENALIHTLQYRDGAVDATWTSEANGDPACCPSIDYEATLRWNGTRIVASDVEGYTEVPTATGFLAAINNHDTAKAATYAAAGVADRATMIAAALPSVAGTPTCAGLNDNLPDPIAALVDPGAGPHSGDGNRLCYVEVQGGYLVLGMDHTGYRSWTVRWVEQV